MTNQQTFFIIKPDAVDRVNDILNIIWRHDITLVKFERVHTKREVVEEHYSNLKDKPFYGEVIDFMSDKDVYIGVAEGDDIVAKLRKIVGATNPAHAEEGTIRRLYGTPNTGENAIHASDSVESARREMALWFGN